MSTEISHTIEQISDAQSTDERFLRNIFVRDQMSEWSQAPLVMARAEVDPDLLADAAVPLRDML